MRSRCQTSESKGLSRASAWTSRGSRASACNRAGVLAPDPEVVGQTKLGADAVRPGRDADELEETLRVGLRAGTLGPGLPQARRRGGGEGGIPTLERGGAPDRADLPGPEEVLECLLDLGPVPAPVVGAAGLVVGEGDLHLACGHRAAGLDLGPDEIDVVGTLLEDAAHPAPGLLGGGTHPEVEQRPGRGRHETRLVRPVLDEATGRPVTGPVEQRGVVGPEPGEEREVLAAGEHVDAVDLDDTDPVDDALDVAHRRGEGCGAWVEEALGGDGDASGLASRQAAGGGAHSPGSMSRWRTAYIAASMRECIWSLSRMLRMWLRTVFSEMKSSVAISRLSRPRATSRRMPSSRSVSRGSSR